MDDLDVMGEVGAASDDADRIAELEAAAAAANERAVCAERQRQMEVALAEAGAIDVESAALVLGVLLRTTDLDARQGVARLKREKAWLFRQTAPAAPSATGAPAIEGAGLMDAAERASRSGDRRSVLEYLRLRRGR
ncbi:MAG: hypothetical protein ACF8QF_01365 [Phycisphaerales bacterium]